MVGQRSRIDPYDFEHSVTGPEVNARDLTSLDITSEAWLEIAAHDGPSLSDMHASIADLPAPALPKEPTVS